jgi:hypothetical protein
VDRDGYEGTTAPYKTEGGKLVTYVSQDPYAYTIYKHGSAYYGARSNEFGYANYEIVPTPQIVVNPLTEMMNQFPIELGLTEQQRQQILPIVKEQVSQPEALKKDASLSMVRKIERLKEISSSVDAKITPLLDAPPQMKFKQMQVERRRKMIERIGNETIEKAEEEIHKIW